MPERTMPEGWPRDLPLTFDRISYARDRAAGLKLTRWGRELERDLDAIVGTLDDALTGYSKLAERLRAERSANEIDNERARQLGVPTDLTEVTRSTDTGARSTSHIVHFNRPLERWEFLAWLEREKWFGFHPAGYSGSASVEENRGSYHHFNTSD